METLVKLRDVLLFKHRYLEVKQVLERVFSANVHSLIFQYDAKQ